MGLISTKTKEYYFFCRQFYNSVFSGCHTNVSKWKMARAKCSKGAKLLFLVATKCRKCFSWTMEFFSNFMGTLLTLNVIKDTWNLQGRTAISRGKNASHELWLGIENWSQILFKRKIIVLLSRCKLSWLVLVLSLLVPSSRNDTSIFCIHLNIIAFFLRFKWMNFIYYSIKTICSLQRE